MARGQLCHLVFVEVDADNVMAQLCHACSMYCTEITTSNNRDPHSSDVLP